MIQDWKTVTMLASTLMTFNGTDIKSCTEYGRDGVLSLRYPSSYNGAKASVKDNCMKRTYYDDQTLLASQDRYQ